MVRDAQARNHNRNRTPHQPTYWNKMWFDYSISTNEVRKKSHGVRSLSVHCFRAICLVKTRSFYWSGQLARRILPQIQSRRGNRNRQFQAPTAIFTKEPPFVPTNPFVSATHKVKNRSRHGYKGNKDGDGDCRSQNGSSWSAGCAVTCLSCVYMQIKSKCFLSACPVFTCKLKVSVS